MLGGVEVGEKAVATRALKWEQRAYKRLAVEGRNPLAV